MMKMTIKKCIVCNRRFNSKGEVEVKSEKCRLPRRPRTALTCSKNCSSEYTRSREKYVSELFLKKYGVNLEEDENKKEEI